MLSGLKKLAQTVGVTSNTTKKMTPVATTPEQEHQPVCARIRCIATVPASIPFIKCFNVTKSKISIGRSIDTCDLILDSRRVAKMISRVHAVIERHESEDNSSMLGRMFRGKRKRYRWTIKDQSVNGLFVNDVRVSESPLNDGDTFTLGGGMTVKMGQTLSQPMSEFIFRWEIVEDVEEEEEEQKEAQTPAAKRQRHALIDSESVTQDYSANGDEGSTQAADGMTSGHDEEGATLDFDAGKTGGNTDEMATQANDAHDGTSDETATQAAGMMPFGDEGATQAAPYGDGDGDEAVDPDQVATP